MSFWGKVSGFFGRVWKGIKSGVKKVGQFIGNVAAPVYNAAKPLINMLPGGSTITTIADAALPAIQSVIKK